MEKILFYCWSNADDNAAQLLAEDLETERERVLILHGPDLKGQCHEIFVFRFSTWIKIRNEPSVIFRDLGEDDSEKN